MKLKQFHIDNLTRKRIEREGMIAYQNGTQITQCPYNKYPNARKIWLMGWQRAAQRNPNNAARNLG